MGQSLYFLGPLDSLFGLADPFAFVNYAANYDNIIISYPFSVGPYGAITAVDNSNIPVIIKAINQPVWLLIDLTPSQWVANVAQAKTWANSLMALFTSEFLRYNISNQLAGFYLKGFGLGAVTYPDGSTFSRNDQNYFVGLAHATYQLPVCVAAYYPSALFVNIGIVGLGPEVINDSPLNNSILGQNPTLVDLILFLNPLYNNSGQATAQNLGECLGVLKTLSNSNLLNLDFCLLQGYNLSACTYDGLVGLEINSTLLTRFRDNLRLISSLGIANFAFYDQNIGSNKIIPPQILTPEAAFVQSGYNQFYSSNAQLIVTRPVVDSSGISVTETDLYDNQLNFISATIP